MDANHNCSIAFEITTSKQKSNLHMNRADHRVQASRIMCGFVVNLKGVWSCPAPSFFCWRINGEILIIKHYYYVNRS